jgi:hypothetical protein
MCVQVRAWAAAKSSRIGKTVAAKNSVAISGPVRVVREGRLASPVPGVNLLRRSFVEGDERVERKMYRSCSRPGRAGLG